MVAVNSVTVVSNNGITQNVTEDGSGNVTITLGLADITPTGVDSAVIGAATPEAATFSTVIIGNADGSLLVGGGINATALTEAGGANPDIQIQQSATKGLGLFYYGSLLSTTRGPKIFFCRSVGSAIGTQTAVASGDLLGETSYQGSDGTAFKIAADESVFADGAISSGIVPGRYVFSTANASGVLTEALRLDSSQNATVAGNITGANLSGTNTGDLSGAMFNVQQGVLTTIADTGGSTTMADTGLSVSITPHNSSNKVLVKTVIQASTDGTQLGLFQLMRGSTPICIGTSVGSRVACSAAAYTGTGTAGPTSVVIEFLDSPATTSATTYKVQYAGSISGGGKVYLNRDANDVNNGQSGRTASTITVTEVHS